MSYLNYFCFDKPKYYKPYKSLLEEFKHWQMDIKLPINTFYRSQNEVCSICMETIMNKRPLTDRCFAIMPNCNHIFCFTCINKWRHVKKYDMQVTKSCPVCRKYSEFVVPSRYWVSDGVSKVKFIDAYKKELSSIPCKYFNKGEGLCSLGINCLYQHQKYTYLRKRKAKQPHIDHKNDRILVIKIIGIVLICLLTIPVLYYLPYVDMPCY